MGKYCIKRLISIIPVLFMISILLFTFMKLMPGDPVALSMDPGLKPEIYKESYEVKKHALGLDKPLYIQYTCYMKELLKGELGYSSTYQKPVREVIARPLMNTVILNSAVVGISLLISITLGILCALYKDSIFDHIINFICTIGISIPTFFIAMLLIYIFAFKMHLFPSGGMAMSGSISDWVYHLVLPVLSMTFISVSSTLRYIRLEMIEVLQSDYIKAAKGRGLSTFHVLYHHALKNAMMPIVTIVMSEIGTFISGSVVIEMLFSWDGIGSVLMKALYMRDAYLIISMNMLYALVFIASNLIADIAYAFIDPRITME